MYKINEYEMYRRFLFSEHNIVKKLRALCAVEVTANYNQKHLKNSILILYCNRKSATSEEHNYTFNRLSERFVIIYNKKLKHMLESSLM